MPATARHRRPAAPPDAPAPAGPPLAHRFADLPAVVDDLHARFDAWEEAGLLEGCLDEFGRHVLRLAVHEWIANLVQHATFGRRRPQIAIALACDGEGVRCEIEDNSAGFDFQRQIAHQEVLVGGDVASDRGRGLLMLIACTDDLAYTPERGRQRLAFRVRPASAGRVGFGALFHLPDDL